MADTPGGIAGLTLPPDVAARLAEADRLRKLIDDAGHGEHNVLALLDHYQHQALAAAARLRAIRELLGEHGCDCPCDRHPDEGEFRAEREKLGGKR